MVDSRKQAISIRMNGADVRKVKKLAQRLSVRDSDVIRFAVKCMLTRLGPLYDAEVKGRNLVPVFVESARRVERDDIALLALTGGQEPYAALLLSELNKEERSGASAGELASSLRQYLYDKYVYRPGGDGAHKNLEVVEPVRLAAVGTHHE